MIFKRIFFLLILTMSFVSYGQEMNVKGTVFDSTGNIPLYNAMVMGVRIEDSVLLGFTRTDKDGKFTLRGFEVDTFSLIIEHPSYDEKIYYMFGHKDNYDITIPSIVMPPKSQELEEVVIYAYKDPIYYKGDTLIYVADSFQVAEGAVVEDLLKKLPGLSVDQDGKITSQGQEISKVLVDGDEFFGSDPTIATKNLGADGIEQVQVYEKENDEGIGGDDEKIKVLDLKLKDDAKKGYFGRISGASDFAQTPVDGGDNQFPNDAFYEGELLLNKFNGSQKLSVFALTSNTPRSNFGWGDMNKFGLENERGGGSRWNPQANANTSGVPQTLKAGVYYSDKFGKKKQTKVGFNYSYYDDRLDANSASESQYFLSDSTYFTDDSTRNYTSNQSHRINLNFETKLDSLTTFRIKPSFTIDKGITEDYEGSEFYDSNRDTTLITSVRNNNDSEGITVGGYASINRKFKKKKREMELRYDISLIDNKTDGFLDSRSTFYSTALPTDSTVQQKINNNANSSHYVTLGYVEPLSSKFKLENEYLFEYGFGNQDLETFNADTITGAYTLFDSTFSNIFENTRQQHRLGSELVYETRTHTISAGVYVRNIDIENYNIIIDTTIKQNITNVLPRFRYTFKPSMSKRFNFNYRTSSSQPSINALAPVPDNSNPNRIQVGNPDLKPNYTHNFNLMFNSWKAISGRYVYAGSNVTYTNNAFGTQTYYDEYGRSQTKTVNVDGNMMGFLFSGAGLPFNGRMIVLEPGINASYIRNVNVIRTQISAAEFLDQDNVTTNYALTPKLDVRFNLFGDSLEIGLKSSYSYNNAVSSLNKTETPYSIQTYGSNIKWRFPKGITVGFDGTYTINDQPGEGFYDTEFLVLNAQLSKKFLKTQNLEVALIGNDLLNQNINARREINANVVTDYRTTIISRYFLLKVTMRFNNRRTKEEDNYGLH